MSGHIIILKIQLSPSGWGDQRGHQGDKLVINSLITIISAGCVTPIYNLYICTYKGLQALICLCGR